MIGPQQSNFDYCWLHDPEPWRSNAWVYQVPTLEQEQSSPNLSGQAWNMWRRPRRKRKCLVLRMLQESFSDHLRTIYQEVLGNDTVAWVYRLYFISNFGILLRMRYPKTSVPAPSERHPVRFRSIASTYKWASVFMEAAADKYGSLWLAKRLRRWRWSLSTAFSGVGCAESASRPHAFETLITFC